MLSSTHLFLGAKAFEPILTMADTQSTIAKLCMKQTLDDVLSLE